MPLPTTLEPGDRTDVNKRESSFKELDRGDVRFARLGGAWQQTGTQNGHRLENGNVLRCWLSVPNSPFLPLRPRDRSLGHVFGDVSALENQCRTRRHVGLGCGGHAGGRRVRNQCQLSKSYSCLSLRYAQSELQPPLFRGWRVPWLLVLAAAKASLVQQRRQTPSQLLCLLFILPCLALPFSDWEEGRAGRLFASLAECIVGNCPYGSFKQDS